MKLNFFNGKYSLNEKSHLKDLEPFMEYYNNERYSTELYGLTLFEVISGKIPHKDYFKEKIQQASKNRVVINQQFNDCKITLGYNF